ncbi:MAG: hypothetical protein HKN23_15770 [Verrucomicrobiales bacterium]|nr:hypothetical protein [Verrucomicrobiales bacterium]
MMNFQKAARDLLPVLAMGLAAFPAFTNAQKLPGEVAAQVGLKQGGRPQGYIQGSNKDAILWSLTEGVRGNALSFAAIRGEGLDLDIAIDGANDALAPGRSLFARGQYEEAAAEFEKVVRAYPTVAFIPRNFASEAAYYQIECLRRAGKFDAMAAAFDNTPAKNIPTHLDESFQKQFSLNRIWALYGQGKLEEVKTAIAPFSIPATGNGKLLPTENFQEMPAEEMIQIAFLRAKIADAAGEKNKALQDYYRVFTVTFGNDVVLSKDAMQSAIAIHLADPNVKNEKDPTALHLVQSLAFQLQANYGTEALPSEYQQYAVKPDLPQYANLERPDDEEGEDAPPPADDGKGKGEDMKGKAGADDGKGKGKAKAPAKADDKGKGKGKGKAGK